jgi:succinate-acetate transporter protein
MIPVVDSEHIHGSITIPNIIVGQAFFYGGVCQMFAGIGAFVAGNTFGATVMTFLEDSGYPTLQFALTGLALLELTETNPICLPTDTDFS